MDEMPKSRKTSKIIMPHSPAVDVARYATRYSGIAGDAVRKHTKLHVDTALRSSGLVGESAASAARAALEQQKMSLDVLSQRQARAVNIVTKGMLQTQQALAGTAIKKAIGVGEYAVPKITESLGVGGLAAKQAQAVAARAVREVRTASEREVEGSAPSPEEVRKILSSRPASA